MRIWIINPFDELPGDTDVRHRYWSLAEACAELGHEVTWWSSNFSHRRKAYREIKPESLSLSLSGSGLGPDLRSAKGRPRPDPDSDCDLDLKEIPFNLQLIPTPPYTKNVSFARLRNHRAFARGFLEEARRGIRSGELDAPGRMVVSLPPLGTADAAFALRGEFGGEVIVDIMDAWPQTFYRAFPSWIPHPLRKLILLPLHRRAGRAFREADRISAVSRIYLRLAEAGRGTRDKGRGTRDQGRGTRDQGRGTRDEGRGTRDEGQGTYHLCYHGIDLLDQGQGTRDKGRGKGVGCDSETSSKSLVPCPSSLVLTYIGALEHSYDLETAIRAVQELNAEGIATELHIAGAGTKEKSLRALVSSCLCERSFQFHGLLNRDALHALLASSHIGLIPMRQDSWVGLPYKLADYCAAGLAVASSLDGDCRELLDTKKAGLFYEPGRPGNNRDDSVESLKAVLKKYLRDPELLATHGRNARAIAEELFDRRKTYPDLARFIVG